MALLMRDSVNPDAIPLAGLFVAAGYADGRYAWTSAQWARFDPVPVKLSIVCFPGSDGDILDIEQGCASPADAAGWCDRFNRPHRRRPTLYVNRGNWNAVRAAIGSRPVDFWVSTLDGSLVSFAVAVQNCGALGSGDPCQTSGDYDESVILDPSWTGGMPVSISAHLTFPSPIHGRILAGASWYNWGDAVNGTLSVVQGYPPPPVDQIVAYSEVVEFTDGTFVDRINTASGPGDWGLLDSQLDTLDVSQCLNPVECLAKYSPPAPPPPPPPGPVLDPRVDRLVIDVAQLKVHVHGVQVNPPVINPPTA